LQGIAGWIPILDVVVLNNLLSRRCLSAEALPGDDVAGGLAAFSNIDELRDDLVAETGDKIGTARMEDAAARQRCQIRDIQAAQLKLLFGAR